MKKNSITRAVALAAAVARDREMHPLDYMAWTPPQLAFLRDDSRYRLLRLGQQG